MIEVFRDEWGIPHLRAGDHLELALAQGRNAVQDRRDQVVLAGRKARGRSAALLGAPADDWDRFARQALLDDTGRRCFETLQPSTKAWVSSYVDGVNAVLDDEPWDPWTPLSVWAATHVLFAGLGSKLWRTEVASRLGPSWLSLYSDEDSFGSNGWMVSGSRSATGLPLLAGDPHRLIEDPGVYQQIHLACDSYDVVGLAVPGIPGLPHFGHTGSVAWCITNAMADYQDLYREESEAGPVIDGIGGERLSLRTPIRELASSGFDALPLLLQARSVADVDAALDRWVEPVNVVLAGDTAGGLLHRVAGRVPVRPREAMLGVVQAATPGLDWTGWHDLPRTTVGDVAVMANERSLAAPLGVDFSADHRASRIRSLLSARASWTASELATVHMDTYNPAASALVSMLDLPGLSPAAIGLADSLRAWDLRMTGASTEAAAYARLRAAVATRLAALLLFAPLASLPPYSPVLAAWLELVPRLGKGLERVLPVVPGLAPLIAAALEEVAALPPARWDALHRLAPVAAHLSNEPWPGAGGDSDCVLATSSSPGMTHAFSRGPAARYVWDVADRARSAWVVPLGASGVRGNPHQRDQLPLWLSGRLVPVVTEWDELIKES